MSINQFNNQNRSAINLANHRGSKRTLPINNNNDNMTNNIMNEDSYIADFIIEDGDVTSISAETKKDIVKELFKKIRMVINTNDPLIYLKEFNNNLSLLYNDNFAPLKVVPSKVTHIELLLSSTDDTVIASFNTAYNIQPLTIGQLLTFLCCPSYYMVNGKTEIIDPQLVKQFSPAEAYTNRTILYGDYALFNRFHSAQNTPSDQESNPPQNMNDNQPIIQDDEVEMLGGIFTPTIDILSMRKAYSCVLSCNYLHDINEWLITVAPRIVLPQSTVSHVKLKGTGAYNKRKFTIISEFAPSSGINVKENFTHFPSIFNSYDFKFNITTRIKGNDIMIKSEYHNSAILNDIIGNEFFKKAYALCDFTKIKTHLKSSSSVPHQLINGPKIIMGKGVALNRLNAPIS